MISIGRAPKPGTRIFPAAGDQETTDTSHTRHDIPSSADLGSTTLEARKRRTKRTLGRTAVWARRFGVPVVAAGLTVNAIAVGTDPTDIELTVGLLTIIGYFPEVKTVAGLALRAIEATKQLGRHVVDVTSSESVALAAAEPPAPHPEAVLLENENVADEAQE
ncbi:MAG TPA: hypothetical protein VMB52_03800 [Verrucomicrobiae bacterium]|nr:hypothetical protein [Verrucomicrobiae bacterium]